MNIRKLLLALLSICVCSSAFGQLPEFYKKVSRVSWVVEDLDQVTQGWRKLGLQEIVDYGEIELNEVQFRGQPARARCRLAVARIGDVEVDWIQPLEGKNAFTEFLAKHGSGIFSLVHRVPTQEGFNREVERLRQLGVGVLQLGTVYTDQGDIRLAYLDTEPEGKYVLGLIYDPGSVARGLASPSTRVPFDKGIVQFAFVARDPQPVSAFWKKLGFPEISITHGSLRNRLYRGSPGQFDHNLGWQRHGTVVYEWCIPLKGPTVYEDHLEAHGEGVHHLAFRVEDMDQVIAEWTALGFAPSQSGAWGEEGKPGSGRFAYMDTDSPGGVTIELLWNFR